MPLHPRTCSFLYSISCLLDALDGYAARIYEQSTRFGAVLDMVTDRCTTACLIVFLSSAFPRWAIVFQGLIALDLASHYMHMYATLVVSGTNASHKSIDESKNWLLRLYYTNKVCLLYSLICYQLLIMSRTFSSLFALSTSFSLSLSTSSASHLLLSRPTLLSLSRQLVPSSRPVLRSTPRSSLRSSPILSALRLSSSLVLTRWTLPCLG